MAEIRAFGGPRDGEALPSAEQLPPSLLASFANYGLPPDQVPVIAAIALPGWRSYVARWDDSGALVSVTYEGTVPR